MKKSNIHVLVILAAIITVGMISTISNLNKNLPYAYAYTTTCAIPGLLHPNRINDFETDHSPNILWAPLESEQDYRGWNGSYYTAVSYPTPIPISCANMTCPPDSMVPGALTGNSFLRLEWTGAGRFNPQYVHLTNYANVDGTYGTNFENLGCGGNTTNASASTTTYTAGDWGCYGYLRLYNYLNFGANNGTPSTVSQTVSLFDGSVTLTSGAITLQTLGFSSGTGNWLNHLTISLNYFGNQYVTTTGRYFSVSNIADVIINAPQTDYSFSGQPTPSIPLAFPTPNSRSLFVYYDNLILGDSTVLPVYQSPSAITVTTATGPPGNPILGAYLGWTPIGPAAYNAAVPPTAYHIYRSLSSSLGTGPYVSIGFVPFGATQYIDTTNYGGAVSCYKILTCNNGPAASSLDEKLNTINATYHEPRLNETIVLEQCGYVAVRPTFTSTPTVTGTPAPPGGPTATNTPIPTAEPNSSLDNAWVYPNPYNPLKGSKKFHIGNVVSGTKVNIYAMDGSRVNFGIYSASTGYTWDGTNINGRAVVAGIYYIVLEDPQKKTAIFRLGVCYSDKCDPVYTAP